MKTNQLVAVGRSMEKEEVEDIFGLAVNNCM